MKKILCMIMILLSLAVVPRAGYAQCAMCTKTAQQLGEKPARGLNSGILYLMLAPFSIIGFIGYRWWRSQKDTAE